MEGVLFFMKGVNQFLPSFHLLSKGAEMLLLPLCFFCEEKCDGFCKKNWGKNKCNTTIFRPGKCFKLTNKFFPLKI
jgi:hypothetical protein